MNLKHLTRPTAPKSYIASNAIKQKLHEAMPDSRLMPNHHKILVASYLVFRREGKILLLRRYNTGYEDGKYGLPSGHLEAGEQPRETAAREAQEEVGVEVAPQDLKFLHAMHRANDGHAKEYIDFFFLCDIWRGEPRNNEPEKCDEVAWFPEGELPSNTISYVRHVMEFMWKLSIKERSLHCIFFTRKRKKEKQSSI